MVVVVVVVNFISNSQYKNVSTIKNENVDKNENVL